MNKKNTKSNEKQSNLGKRPTQDKDDDKFQDAVKKVQVLGVAENLEKFE